MPVVLVLLFLLGGLLVWLTGSRVSEQFSQFTGMIPTSKARLPSGGRAGNFSWIWYK